METKTRVSYDIAKFAFEQAKTYYSFGAGKARYVAAQAAFERALDALTKEDLEALNALRQ